MRRVRRIGQGVTQEEANRALETSVALITACVSGEDPPGFLYPPKDRELMIGTLVAFSACLIERLAEGDAAVVSELIQGIGLRIASKTIAES